MSRTALSLLACSTLLLGATAACGQDAPTTSRSAAPAAAALTATEQDQVDAALTSYERYVARELDRLVTATDQFVAAIKAGEDARARQLYPRARTHWERVEPIAATFGDLDPAIDAREAGLSDGEAWTGWHPLEKDLWPARAVDYTPLTDDQRTALATRLARDTRMIRIQGAGLELTLDDLVGGAQGLLEEVASGKVTGEEEYWSRTDLFDFQANIDGAKTAFQLLEPVIAGRDAALARTLATQFATVQSQLDDVRSGDGFIGYDQLRADQIAAFSDIVNALGESLARVSTVL